MKRTPMLNPAPQPDMDWHFHRRCRRPLLRERWRDAPGLRRAFPPYGDVATGIGSCRRCRRPLLRGRWLGAGAAATILSQKPMGRTWDSRADIIAISQ